MKKFLFLGFVALCAWYAYYVYASSSVLMPNAACLGKNIWECKVWCVNSDGTVALLLEEGRNSTIVVPEPYE